MTTGLPGWLRLPLVMVGWAAIVVASGVDPWLALGAGVLLFALWLWRLRATSEPGQPWGDTLLFAITWAAWGLAAWIGILFLIYVGYFVGAYFEWWEIHDE